MFDSSTVVFQHRPNPVLEGRNCWSFMAMAAWQWLHGNGCTAMAAWPEVSGYRPRPGFVLALCWCVAGLGTPATPARSVNVSNLRFIMSQCRFRCALIT